MSELLLPVAGWTAEILVRGAARTVNIDNRFHYQSVGTTDKLQIRSAFIATIMPLIQACLNVDYAARQISVRWLSDVLDPYNDERVDLRGSVDSDSMPTFCTVVISLKSNKRGRNYQGRKFFSPISKSDKTKDHLTGNLAAWLALRDTLAMALTLEGRPLAVPVVYSQATSQQQTQPTQINHLRLKEEAGCVRLFSRRTYPTETKTQ
jgi:hypothetical protein